MVSSDAPCFADLYDRCYPQLIAYCRRRLGRGGADGEEVAQEAFVHAWIAWETYSPDRPFWPWLATIAKRLCIDRSRGTQRGVARRHAEARLSLSHIPSPDELIEGREEARLAMAALRTLRAHDQRIIGLRDLHGWSYREIAVAEGVTVESVRAALRRARVALRSQYAALTD